MSTGENLLHVLNTLESRSVVLEAELREIDDDILLNATMQRKYGAEFFTEGAAKLTQTRVRAAPLARRAHGACAARAHRAHDAPRTCTAAHRALAVTPLTASRSRAQLEKQQRLAEIRMQLQQTGQSVRQGKQLLGSLADSYGTTTAPEPMIVAHSPQRVAETPGAADAGGVPSPTRILTTSPILSEKRGRA